MVAGAISVAGYIGNRADDRILAALPFSFDAGFSQLTTGFFAGAAVILLDYLLPKDVLKTASVQNATGLTGVPPLWNQLVALEWPQDVADNFRYIANTGGAMPTATLEKLRSNLPRSKVFLMYGLTEAFRSTYLPPEELDRRPTSIGKAIPNAEILVVREDGTRCSPGEPGELVHRGALVSLGYWNDPERTAQRFKPLPGQLGALPFAEMTVWSGDTVVTDEDGFIYFVGRRDDMIKSSGYRISPTEVEEVVYKTGLVSECAALGIPHPVIGQAVVVAAVGPSPDEATAAEIVKACREALPNFMVPQAIEWQIQMPKNPNGKIDRKSLVESLTDYYEETD
jgi:acyl-CoA ligase (AMP-forming) (exosortase A-associated)